MKNEKNLRWYVLGKDKKLTEVTKQNEEQYFNTKKYRLNKDEVDLTEDYVLISQYRPTKVEWVPQKLKDRYNQLIRYMNIRRKEKGFPPLISETSYRWFGELEKFIIQSYPHADLNAALNLILTSGRITSRVLDDLANGNSASLISALNAKRSNKNTERYGDLSKSLNDVLTSNFEISIVESDFYAEYYDLSSLESPSSDREEYDFIYSFKGLSKDD